MLHLWSISSHYFTVHTSFNLILARTLCTVFIFSLSSWGNHGLERWNCLSEMAQLISARILEWVAIPFSRGSSRPRNWTHISYIAGRYFTVWATREAQRICWGICSYQIKSLTLYLWGTTPGGSTQWEGGSLESSTMLGWMAGSHTWVSLEPHWWFHGIKNMHPLPRFTWARSKKSPKLHQHHLNGWK